MAIRLEVDSTMIAQLRLDDNAGALGLACDLERLPTRELRRQLRWLMRLPQPLPCWARPRWAALRRELVLRGALPSETADCCPHCATVGTWWRTRAGYLACAACGVGAVRR